MTATTRLHPTKSSHHRFHFLDALRGIASILVVFLHTPFYISFRPVHNAHLAVDFFFGLSGFVIAFSYEKRLQDALRLKDFMIARAIRLYPIYLLGIIAGIAAFFAFDFHLQRPHIVLSRLIALICLQLVMLPPLRLWYSVSLFPLDFPAWSMFFEVLANLAYAWMLRRRMAGTGPLLTIILISLAILSCWLIRGGVITVGALRTAPGLLGIFRVALSFLTGVLIFRLFRRQGTPHWPALHSAAIALLVAATMIFILIGPYAAMRHRLFNIITVAALFPCLLYLGARCRLSPLWHKPCTFLGDLSYPLYLLHVPFLGLLSLPWIIRAAHQHPATQYVLVPGVLLIAGIASVLATRYYDVPLRRFLTTRYNNYLLKHAVPIRA